MTSKEFMRKNPFDCKSLIGPQSRCKQEIKWVVEGYGLFGFTWAKWT